MSTYRHFLAYGLAIGSTTIALMITFLLEPWLTQSIGVFFAIAIIITTWYGGLRPGFVAIILSVLAINHFFVPPIGQFRDLSLSDLIRLTSLSLIAIVIHVLSHNLRVSKRQVEQLTQKLLEESADLLHLALEETKTSKALLQQQFEQQRLVMDQVQTEIKERKQAEQTLAKELVRIQTLLHTSFDGIVIMDQQGRVLEANSRFMEMLGYTPEEVTTLFVWDWNAEYTCSELQQMLGDYARFKSGVFETRHRRKDGSIYDAEVSLNIVEWEGEVLRFSVCRDITERKRNEEKHKEAELALQQLNAELEQRIAERTADLTDTNEQLRQSFLDLQLLQQETEDLYNNAPCGYHSLNEEGIIVRINNTELEWLGYTSDEILYKKKFVDLMPFESQVIFYQRFPKLIQQGWLADVELQLCSKDGSTRWVNLSSTAVKDDAGRFLMSRTTLFDISDRKRVEAEHRQAEVALRESEEKFRQLAENLEAVFWMRDAIKQQVIYVSPAYETIWQQSCTSLYRDFSNWINSICPEDRERVETAALQLVTEGHYDEEYRICRPDGSTRWIRDRAVSIRDKEGEVLRVAGLAEDITDRKETEATLLLQSKLEQLRWHITQSIRQSLDLNAILNTAVEQMRLTLQVDRVAVYRFRDDWSGDFIAESISDNWQQRLGSNVQKVWEDTYLQETQGGRFKNQETFVVPDIQTAGLDSCHIELLEQFGAKAYAVAPIFSGTALWGLLAIYQNSTTREWQAWEIELLQQIASQLAIAIQQAELYKQLQVELQERKQTLAILREAERRWRSLLENVQLIVVGADQLGAINYVNPFFLTLTGYTDSEVLGKDWAPTFLPPAYRPTVQSVFADLITQNTHSYYQNPILTKTGEERLIAWNNTQLRDLDGNVIGIISIGEDITERQKVEKMKDEFLGIVSHELRTPLTAIQMSLGLLKTGVYAKKPEKAQRMIEIALIDTNRLVNLVNDILDLERLESGRNILEKVICQASDLMEQAADGVRAIAAQHNIALTIVPTNVLVWADADSIIQTVTNLLSNAIKFSPPNSVIQLGAQYQTDQILFQVSDQGRGIPANKLETIFGRFQQVDASDAREKGGTGLGLAICRSIIERHGGKIWAESTLGEGSTFFFTLPVPSESSR